MFATVLCFGDISNVYEFQENDNVEQKVKISMTIGEVPKVGILNISKDVEQKLMFSMVCGGGKRAGCE